MPSDSALPPTFKPSTAADDADDQRHERRLDRCRPKMVDRSMAIAQPVDEGDRRDVGIDAMRRRCRRRAAAKLAAMRQARQGDHQRHQARKNQHADRIEADHGQRVDLLAHLHRADLGRDGAAGTAGDHDRRHQHAKFPQDKNADQIDDENVGAEIERAGRRPAAPRWRRRMADISTTTGMAPTPMRSIWLKMRRD